MSKTLESMLSGIPVARKRKIRARTRELVAGELTLRELRKTLHLTQAGLAKRGGMSQDRISKIESNGDLRLSTLLKTVDAMGGKLKLVVEFLNRKSVVLDVPLGLRARTK